MTRAGSGRSFRTVSTWASVILFLFIPVTLQADDGDDSRPLNVRVDADARHYFVGQEIRLTVRVVAESSRPEIRVPKVDQAVASLVDSSFRQLSASSIGTVVNEVNQYVSQYSLVANRAGKLTIPPFVARASGRTGASAGFDLTVVPVPSDGRPASWLRGVGAIEANAKVEPKTIRLGQTADLALSLKGPGALASTTVPVLAGFEPGAVDVVPYPPERTFHYRIRPNKPGTVEIPSVEVATFDPKFQQFVRTRTPRQVLEVVDIPRFDPTTFDAQPPVAASQHKSPGWEKLAGLVAVIPLVLGGVWLAVTLRRSPRGLARRLASDLAAARPGEVASKVMDSIATYLHATTGWAGGELTPDEARERMALVVDDPWIVELARLLIELSDRDRFGGGLDHAELEGMAGVAVSMFRRLSLVPLKRVKPEKTEGGSRNRAGWHWW